MLLTIDVGNTTVGIAVFSGGTIVTQNKLFTPDEVTVSFLKSLIKKEYRTQITDVIVSSVVPFVDKSLKQSLREYFHLDSYFIDHTSDSGLALKIDCPAELGADRLADAVGALCFFDAPVIAIDSGTATTFEIVGRNHEYLGGCIFPGIELSINSLAKNTAKLERITFGIPDSILGTNTDTSIRAGIFYMYVGALTYMIKEYKKMLGEDTKVIATGGLSRYFEKHVENIDLFEPNLLYFGLKRIYDRIKKNG